MVLILIKLYLSGCFISIIRPSNAIGVTVNATVGVTVGVTISITISITVGIAIGITVKDG